MPQGRRKVAFSGKKKKEQLRARKERKLCGQGGEERPHDDIHESSSIPALSSVVLLQQMGLADDTSCFPPHDVQSLNQQPGSRTRVNRYNLKFRKETAEEVSERKRGHHAPINPLPNTDLELSTEAFFPPGLSYPSRPKWKKNVSKAELDMNENRHFRLFCEKLDRDFAESKLGFYELNLETWRQLWRVTEMSDILLIIVDARFPVAQFPPYLYEQLVEKKNKGIILVLNKCDLLPPSVIVAWEKYFLEKFPKLLMVPFSSMEGCAYKKRTLKMAAQSALRLVDSCQKLIEDTVDLSLWRTKIEEEKNLESDGILECVVGKVTEESLSTMPEAHQRYKDGVLTIGTIGHPNVGKSSLINALMGKKVVSVSKTPGHTKHFQTIFLTKNVKLCDCPGLVFPSTVTIPLQALLGSFPVAQVRNPVGVVNYIASRLDIPSILKLECSDLEEDENQCKKWTPYCICEAWAKKRGYRTRRKGTPDVSRAANEILRLCLNGHKSLILFFRPPGYTHNKELFEADEKIEEIKLIQGVHAKVRDAVSAQGIVENNEEDLEDDDLQDAEVVEEEGGASSTESEEEDAARGKTRLLNKFTLLMDDD